MSEAEKNNAPAATEPAKEAAPAKEATPAKEAKKKEDEVPENTVVVHCFESGKTIPNLSPFVLKLVTYLRMTGIPYLISTKKPLGPKGKSPWITLNGENMGDSQLIVEFLSKKFEKNVWGNATDEQKAIARLARLVLEEHFVWGLGHWRWIKNVNNFGELADIPSLRLKFMKYVYGRKLKNTMYDAGIGRHTYDEMVGMMEEDLINISNILGTKKFILGNEPVEADCAIFGMLAQIVYTGQGSPYEKLINEKLTNLKEYTVRMKEKYWEDWDKCLAQPKPAKEEKKAAEASPSKGKEKESSKDKPAAEATPEPATATT